jgi:hypothetical protein
MTIRNRCSKLSKASRASQYSTVSSNTDSPYRIIAKLSRPYDLRLRHLREETQRCGRLLHRLQVADSRGSTPTPENLVLLEAQDNSLPRCPLLLACCYGAINRFAELDDMIGQSDVSGALPIADLARSLVSLYDWKSFLLS